MKCLLLLLFLVGCEYHTHRIFWYCDNHTDRHGALNKEDRVYASERYGCKGWYPINEEVH